MRAAVHTVYGPPEVVTVRDVPCPEIGHTDLLVKVHATTVNRTDCHYRSATPFPMRFMSGLRRPRATVLGNEFAGEVAAVGAGVTTYEVGDRVFGYVEGRFGAHAEYLAIPSDRLLARIPEHLGFIDAAPSTEASHYALSHLRRAGVTAGHEVLVYGASGGIGTAAVQLAKALGATVIGATPMPAETGSPSSSASAPTGSSTTPPRTSPATSSATTSCSTPGGCCPSAPPSTS